MYSALSAFVFPVNGVFFTIQMFTFEWCSQLCWLRLNKREWQSSWRHYTAIWRQYCNKPSHVMWTLNWTLLLTNTPFNLHILLFYVGLLTTLRMCNITSCACRCTSNSVSTYVPYFANSFFFFIALTDQHGYNCGSSVNSLIVDLYGLFQNGF